MPKHQTYQVRKILAIHFIFCRVKRGSDGQSGNSYIPRKSSATLLHTMSAKPTTIDEYLAPLANDKRAALEKLRKTILSIAPDATECISYGLPTFAHKRKLVAMGAEANHCALYVLSSSLLNDFRDDVAGYDTTKGSIHFTPDKPLPLALVKKLVKARMAENAALDEERATVKAAPKTTKKPVKKARSGA